jgi:hypothetical protein
MSYHLALRASCMCVLATTVSMALAQASQKSTQTASGAAIPQAQQGGSATGRALPPMLDAEHRPITAGGFVKSGPIVFQDISEKSGLASWHHRMGNVQKEFILDAIGSGVALLDYDNDG